MSRVHLAPSIVAAMNEHAESDPSMEACGVIVGSALANDGGVALRYVPLRNIHQSRLRFEIDSLDLLRLDRELDDADEAFWGIFHSHVASPAVPSATDLRMGALWPGTVWVLRSLTDDPPLRAWLVPDGERIELALEVG